jgi:hypothetical protein
MKVSEINVSYMSEETPQITENMDKDLKEQLQTKSSYVFTSSPISKYQQPFSWQYTTNSLEKVNINIIYLLRMRMLNFLVFLLKEEYPTPILDEYRIYFYRPAEGEIEDNGLPGFTALINLLDKINKTEAFVVQRLRAGVYFSKIIKNIDPDNIVWDDTDLSIGKAAKQMLTHKKNKSKYLAKRNMIIGMIYQANKMINDFFTMLKQSGRDYVFSTTVDFLY